MLSVGVRIAETYKLPDAVGFQAHVTVIGAEPEAILFVQPGILFPFTRKVTLPSVETVADRFCDTPFLQPVPALRFAVASGVVNGVPIPAIFLIMLLE